MRTTLIRQSLVSMARDAILNLLTSRSIAKLAPERKLCRELRISRPTLRHALRLLEKDGFLAPRGRQGWVIVKHVRKRPSEKMAQVCLLQDNTANRFINEHLQLLEFLADHLRSSRVDFHVETNHRCFSAHPESALENLVSARRADLWILYLSTHAIQQWFRDRRIPCIVYGSSYPDMNHIFVDEDWLATSTHAAGMFLAKGHRHLAILERINPRPGDRKCMAGFRRGLKASRHKNILLHVAQHDETAHGICRAVASLLNREVPPTGWLITNAQVYLTVLSFLASRRIRVGADISLICCRSDVYLDCIIPSVAHYRRNVYSMNQRLLKLANLILKGVPPVRRKWHVLSKYCTGDSLQPPPSVRPIHAKPKRSA